MRSFFHKKPVITLLAALALVSLTVLALSLNQVSFKAGQRFGQPGAEAGSGPSVTDIVSIWSGIPIWKHVVLWSSIVLMVIMVSLLLSPEMRKRLFLYLIRATLTLIGLYYLFKNYGGNFLFLQNLGASAPGAIEMVNTQPMPDFEPPQVSPTVSYLVSFAVALLFILVMWGMYRAWKKYNALYAPKPLTEIARITRSALHDLSSGRDSNDVIITCYLRMSDVVADRRQLHREAAMTPQEFALRLERAGLPGDAVRRLTRLFEVVRYGDRRTGPQDVNEAVSCLNTILHYCGEAA